MGGKVQGTGFGRFLKTYRQARNITRGKFAETLGMSDGYLGLLERGERKPSYDVLIGVIKTLKVSADDVLGIDSYIGHEAYVSDLSIQMNKLGDEHRKLTLQLIDLMVASLGEGD